MAEISVIVIAYNGLHENTVHCLESVFRHSGKEDYELIVVDNNSTDGTGDYLGVLAGREPLLKPVLNQSNRGFAGGNNDGMRVASGNIIVLLNNDTLVTEGWLTKLKETLLSDQSIGLAGPVSNAVGNEQKIFTCGNTPADIIKEGEAWTRNSIGDTFKTERLGFFCVAFRREIMETVGLLDEAYDLGFFEDDDYCLRVQKAGYMLICREDIFVYHQGSASFGRNSKKIRELLRKNRSLLERKFDIKYSPRHPRDRQLDLVESYIEKHLFSENKVSLGYKIENRFKLINELIPHGFLKRRIFKQRLNTVMQSWIKSSHQPPAA